jgi:hypothetical protein
MKLERFYIRQVIMRIENSDTIGGPPEGKMASKPPKV